jgi:hypothetical protein
MTFYRRVTALPLGNCANQADSKIRNAVGGLLSQQWRHGQTPEEPR